MWLQPRETAASSPTPPPSTCPLQKGEVDPLSAQEEEEEKTNGWELRLSPVEPYEEKGCVGEALSAQTAASEKRGGDGVEVGG